MTVITRRLLREAGVTDRQIAAAVRAGTLLRIRGGLFAEPSIPPEMRTALTAGGRLACASELKRRGVWVLDDAVHVHFTQRPNRSLPVVRHWQSLLEEPTLVSVSITDATREALECLPRRSALAALDSVLHLGLMSRSSIDLLPLTSRARRVADLGDARAESGLESIARLIAHDLGFRVTPQVSFAGIGRVDLVVEGAVVVEADGDQFHSDVAARRRDRRRDALLAAIDRPVLRFGYEQLVGRPGEVAQALVRTVAGHPEVKDSRSKTARAVARARKRGWA